MEQSEEIRRLLEEIRDLQREHLAEYRRISEEVIQSYRNASERANAQYDQYERANAQYRASRQAAQGMTWALFILIAVCVGANLFMIYHMAGGR